MLEVSLEYILENAPLFGAWVISVVVMCWGVWFLSRLLNTMNNLEDNIKELQGQHGEAEKSRALLSKRIGILQQSVAEIQGYIKAKETT